MPEVMNTRRNDQAPAAAQNTPSAARQRGHSIPEVSEVIAGRFRIERVLGQGGMGVVLAAEDLAQGGQVAIKLLLPRAVRASGAVERFVREARAAAAIRSEHVARVMEVGQLDSGLPYLVMEHLRGETLDRVLDTRGALPVEEAVAYVMQACEAIAQAHALGIVHRDLKPANLFLTSGEGGRPLVKVLDFGVSKTSDAAALPLTATNAMLGSPYYMSPEQVRCARDVDARTDVWALGVILYELLTGRRPFEGDSMFDLLVAVTTHEPTPVRVRRPDLPAGLEVILQGCLTKDPSRRVQTIAELVDALAPFAPASARRSAAPPAPPAPPPIRRELAPRPSSPAPSSSTPPSSGWRALLTFGVAAAAICLWGSCAVV